MKRSSHRAAASGHPRFCGKQGERQSVGKADVAQLTGGHRCAA